MATYYVRTDGNDANTGLGSTTALAWCTVQKALGAAGIGSGDTVYIAPGVYRENITIAGTYSAATYIIGDPTAAQFPDVAQGLVRLTNYLTLDTAAGSGTIMSSGNKNYLNISYLYFDGSATMLSLGASAECVIENCAFIGSSAASSVGVIAGISPGVTINHTIRKCIFMVGSAAISYGFGFGSSSDWSVGLTVQDCVVIGGTGIRTARTAGAPSLQGGGINVYNCYIQSCTVGVFFDTGDATYPPSVMNCIIANCTTGLSGRLGAAGVQNYNRIIGCTTTLTNFSTGANTVTVGPVMVDIGMSQLFGLSAKQTWFSALPGSLNIGFGDPTGALTTDLFGATWFNGGSDPDAGALTSIQLSNTSYYYPTERNASTITIAPGSTSQSIELYLGATGLTFATSGLSAYYVRNREAPTPITLVTQTATGTWASGGFAEISSAFTPGVYRLDVPNDAFAAGFSDVTIVVRGASGTNGAVLTVTLSSGGLTAAQTAQAVLDATASTHNNIGSIGASIQDKAGYSLSTPQSFSTTGSVGSVTGNVAGNVTGTVGGVVGNVTGNIAGSVATVASPDNIIDGVWDEQRVGHTASGSFGEKLQTNALADEMLARDLGSGLNAGTAEERTVRSALRAIRNKVNVGSSQMVVKKEDDTTDAWTASVTTTAVSSNVSGIDPN